MRLEETGEATSGDHQDNMPASPLAKMQYSVSETHSYAAADMKSWCCIAYVHPYHPLQKPPGRPSPRSSCKWEVRERGKSKAPTNGTACLLLMAH